MTPEFADYVAELLEPLGRISLRKMFGGAGVYCDGVIFALIVDDVLYLKTDEHNRPAFEAAGCEPFSYLQRGEVAVSMSYSRAPDEAMDSHALMQPWARDALAAALRARARPAASRRKRG